MLELASPRITRACACACVVRVNQPLVWCDPLLIFAEITITAASTKNKMRLAVNRCGKMSRRFLLGKNVIISGES